MDNARRRYLLRQGVREEDLRRYELADGAPAADDNDDAAGQGDQDESRDDDDEKRLERSANQIARRRHGMTTEELAYRARRGEDGAEGKLQAVYKAAARRSGYRGGMLAEPRQSGGQSRRLRDQERYVESPATDDDLEAEADFQLRRAGTSLRELADKATHGDAEAATQLSELYRRVARDLGYRGA